MASCVGSSGSVPKRCRMAWSIVADDGGVLPPKLPRPCMQSRKPLMKGFGCASWTSNRRWEFCRTTRGRRQARVALDIEVPGELPERGADGTR